MPSRVRSAAAGAARALAAALALVACRRDAGSASAADARRTASPPDASRVSIVGTADAAVDMARDSDGPSLAATTEWTSLGNGVSARAVSEARGPSLFVGLAGWRITDASTRAWIDALTEARLRTLGVGRVYAVRGPEDVSNRTHDLAVSALVDDLIAHVTVPTSTVWIVAHSSGQLVATELFHRLFVERADHGAPLRDRILFVSLDGDADIAGEPSLQLAPETVAPLRHAWFVSARDSVRGTRALSNATMRAQNRRYDDRSDYLEFDARNAGCATVMCVHLSLINPHPLARGNASYATFGSDGPNVFWLDEIARTLR